MRRYLLISLVFVAACGGAGLEDAPVTAGNDSTTSTAEATETTPAESVDSSQPTATTQPGEDATTTTASDLPVAPDFSLELGTGGEFRLSDTENPVYLVFWAEW